MSISSAPAATAARTSASFTSSGAWPDGKAVATDATLTELPETARRATAASLGYTHTAATGGMLASPGSGRCAFAESARTFPGVSAPSSVVRSIIRIARSSANSFDSRLIDRFASSAARPSSDTASTDPRRGSRPPPGSSSDRGSAIVWLMESV
jgi:hypothetical protein